MSAEREHRQRVADFIAREWNRLVGAVRSWIDDEADRDAEDIVQDVLAGLFEHGDPTAPIRDLSAFVWRSLRNRVTDRFRARRATVSLDADAGASVADCRSEAGTLAQRREIGARIDAAIASLGDDERDVFLATEMEGMKFRELAATWDTPIGTLLARKYRAVRRLRAALADIDRDERGGAS